MKRVITFLIVLSFVCSAQSNIFFPMNYRKMLWGGLFAGVGVATMCGAVRALYKHPSRMRFNWDDKDINLQSLCFDNNHTDEPFLWGVATSAYQVEGQEGASCIPYNQWQACETKDIKIQGKTSVPVPHISGSACEHFSRYKEDIQLMKQLGITAFRFSISWGKVEPRQGEFNESVLEHYEDVCKELVANGIKPVVTLHHYTHPCWFEDLRGFEKKRNIRHFVRFCKKVFTRLYPHVHLWFSFNTFTGYALAGFSQGTKPPFKHDLTLAIEVMKNMLEAHVRMYRALKRINKSSTIGIYKNIFQLDPWNLFNPLDRFYCYMGNYISNDAIYNYFTTGKFNVWIPTKVSMDHVNRRAIGATDVIGLNYYSGAYVKNCKVIPRPECISTQNSRYTIYPEGFYRALHTINEKLAKPLGIPIYVTENGIAAHNNKDRDIFYKRYLYALSKAMDDGIDVRGYLTWSLMDNYEWSYGYDVKYGICNVNFTKQERTLKHGAEFLVSVFKHFSPHGSSIGDVK